MRRGRIGAGWRRDVGYDQRRFAGGGDCGVMRFTLTRSSASFRFLNPGVLVDRELRLVAPRLDLIEPAMAAIEHPLTLRDDPELAAIRRSELVRQVEMWPGGHQQPVPTQGIVPAYHFWMEIDSDGAVGVAGAVALRIGSSRDLRVYYGHVGYHVYPLFRGRNYAERAVRLLLPLARAHRQDPLWITTNPDNDASRRTCEKLGARLVEIVRVPRRHPLYLRGDHAKCRYRLDLPE